MESQSKDQTYHEKVDRAGQQAKAGGCPGDWNTHFRQNLEKEGLRLAPYWNKSEDYPDRAPYLAPIPYGPVNGWPRKTYIVWKQTGDSR